MTTCWVSAASGAFATGTLISPSERQIRYSDAYLRSVGLAVKGRKERRAFRKLIEHAYEVGYENGSESDDDYRDRYDY